MTGGTYTLLLELPEATTVEVGAIGERRFPAGAYAYTGSAFGPVGFARVDRHYELATGEREVRRWHVDYLLCVEGVAIRGDVRSTDAAVECAVARELPAGPLEGFGASDCDCRSHLAYHEDVAALHEAVATAHRGADDD